MRHKGLFSEEINVSIGTYGEHICLSGNEDYKGLGGMEDIRNNIEQRDRKKPPERLKVLSGFTS